MQFENEHRGTPNETIKASKEHIEIIGRGEIK